MVNIQFYEYNYEKYSIRTESGKELSKENITKIFNKFGTAIAQIDSELPIFDNESNSKVIIKKLKKIPETEYLESIFRDEKNWLKKMGAEAKIAFAMHLFRNADREIFSMLTGLKKEEFHHLEISLLEAIRIWIQFFEETLLGIDSSENEEISKMLPALKDLEHFQSKIEKIRGITDQKSRIQAKTALNKEILNKALKALKNNRPFYMPGGYVNPKEGEIVPMLYEISKSEDDNFFNFRVVDLSETVNVDEEIKNEKIENKEDGLDWEKPKEKIQASFTFTKDINELDIIIEDSLDAQISPPHILYNPKIGTWAAIKNLSIYDQTDEVSTERSEIVKEIASGKKIERKEDEIRIKKQRAVHPGKLVEIFLKTASPSIYKGKKTLFKISSFLSLYKQLGKNLQDPRIRKWLKSNALSLLETVQKKIDEKDPKVDFLQKELEKIIKTLNTLDVIQETRIPDGATRISKMGFSKPLNTPGLEDSEKFKISEVRSPRVSPLKEISSEMLSAVTKNSAIIELFRENLNLIQKLNKKGDIKNASLLLEDYSRILDNEKVIEAILEKISGDIQASEKLAGILKDFNFLALEINYRLGFVVPEPRFIHYNLQSLVLADKLFRKNPSCELREHKFDMAPIEQILQDSFLNLGSKGVLIAKDLEYLSEPDPNSYLIPLRLTNPNPEIDKSIYKNDRSFFENIARAHLDNQVSEKKVKKIKGDTKLGKLISGASEDIGQIGILSKQLTDMRQMYIMTQTLLAPTRTLIAAGIGSLFAVGMNMLQEMVEKQKIFDVKEAGAKIYPMMFQENIRRLKSIHGPIEIDLKKSPFCYGNQFFIRPWNLAIQDFDDALWNGVSGRFHVAHPEIYKENMIPLEDEKAKNVLFKQNVAVEQADSVDDEGEINKKSLSKFTKYQTFGVTGKLQLSIIREKLNLLGLPSDVVQDLQLMETGDNTRIKETVGKLKKYASLLNEGKQAPILMALFERNFFRKNLLLNTLKRYPHYAQILISTLKEISQELEDSHQYRAYLFLQDLCNQIGGVLPQVGITKFDWIKTEINKASEELHKLQLEFRHKTSLFKEKADRKEMPYFTCQRDFHFYFLLNAEAEMESKPLNEIYSDDIVKSYFILKNSIADLPLDPQKLNRIEYLMHRLLPEIQLRLKKNCKGICNEFLKSFADVDLNEPWIEEGESGLVFKNENFTIDFKEGVIWHKNKRISFLPGSVLKHPDLEKVQEILKKNGYRGNLSNTRAAVCNISYKEIEGVQYDFSLKIKEKPLDCRIIATDDGVVRFYKNINGNWYQFQSDITAERQIKIEGKGEKNNQAQLVKSSLFEEAKDSFPLELAKYTIWVGEKGSKLIAENDEGEVVYTGNLSGGEQLSITSLTDERTKQILLNPWAESRFNVFRNIEESSHITVKGKSGKASEVSYSRFNLTYKWNETEAKWISSQHPKHYLSGKTIAKYFSDHYQELDYDSTELQRLFSGTFIHYQVLESDSEWPKVVLTGFEYAKTQPPSDLFSLQSLTKIEPKPKFDVKNETIPVFVFTADPNQGLKTDNPDGYLYLAYSLFTQGKYKEAIRYLKKGDINQPLSEIGAEIFSWLKKYEDDSPEAKAVKMHAIFLHARQVSVLTPLAKQPQSQSAMMEPIHFEMYKKLVKEGKISKELQLSEKEREDYARHAEKLVIYIAVKLKDYQKEIHAFMEDFSKEAKAVDEKEKTSEKLETLLSLFHILDKDEHQTIKKILGELHITPQELLAWNKEGILQDHSKENLITKMTEQENQHQMRQKNSYKHEINSLKQILKKRKKELKIERPLTEASKDPIPILDPKRVEIVNSYFKIEEKVDEKAKNLTEKLNEFCKFISYEGQKIQTDQEYAKEIGTELAEDLRFNIDNQDKISGRRILQDPSSQLSPLKESFFNQKRLNHKAKNSKKEALELLPHKPKTGSKWDDMLNLLKERNSTWKESIFDTALRCFGENDWSSIEQLFEDKEQFKQNLPKLETCCREFLKNSIRSRQCGRGKTAVEELVKIVEENKKHSIENQKDENFIRKSQELYSIINEGWSYNPDQDADARSLLLIEYELGFICRASQVSVVRETLSKDNLFKQEICGGGKTTVLRNIITHIWANGVNLSAVSTLEPLRKTHGVLFSRTTLHAFGEKSFPFVFSRKTPSDETSLLKLHRNLLNVIVERGRVDLTKSDLNSFNHEHTLKQERVRTLKKTDPESPLIESLQKEIDIMEEISDLLFERAVINADELDKDCDPTQEKNYAHGEPISLNEDQTEAGLVLMEKILTSKKPDIKKLKAAIRANKQKVLSEKEINAGRKALAEEVFNTYRNELELDESDKIDFTAYLNEIPLENQKKSFKEFYEAHIKPKKEEEKRKTEIKNTICFMHEFLSEILPNSFTKAGGVNFGRSKDGLHVIPFGGSDRAREGSQHAKESEQIWYALLDYASLRSGVTRDQIYLLLANAKKSAAEEIDIQRQLNPEVALPIEETKAAKKFKEKFGKSLQEITEKDFETISKAINKDPKSLISFVRDWVLPEYQLNSEKIEGDAQDPPNMVHGYFGSAGTDYAKYAMPDPIDISNVRQKGVHGEIIRRLIEIDSSLKENQINSFLTTKEGEPEEVLELLAKQIKGGDCLSDVGVSFPGWPASEIAIELSKKRPELTIRLMNRQDEWLMCKGGKIIPLDSNIALKDVFTIFDDTHTRGAERPSMDGVVVYVTIDEKTRLSKFEQGVLRERGVTTGKATARYILSPSLQAKWKGEPDLNKLFHMLDENEADGMKILNMKAEKQKIRAIAKHGIKKAVRQFTKDSKKQLTNEKAQKNLQSILAGIKGLEEIDWQKLTEKKMEQLPDLKFELKDILRPVQKTKEVIGLINNSIKQFNGILDIDLIDIVNKLDNVKAKFKDQEIINNISEFQKELKTLSENQKEIKKLIPEPIDTNFKTIFGAFFRFLKILSYRKNFETIAKQYEEMKVEVLIQNLQKRAGELPENINKAVQRAGGALMGEITPTHWEARDLIFDCTRKYFIKPSVADPIAAGEPSEMKNSGDVLKDLAADEHRKLNDLIRKDGELLKRARETKNPAIIKDVEAFCTHIENNAIPKLAAKFKVGVSNEGHKGRLEDRLLPKEVSNKQGELDQEQSVEQEQEQEAEMETEQEHEQEAEVEGRGGITEINHKHLKLNKIFKTGPIELATFFAGQEQLTYENFYRMNEYVPHQTVNKFFTENFSPVSQGKARKIKPWSILAAGKSLPPDQNRITRTLFIINTATGKVGELIPSLKDNDLDIEEYVESHSGYLKERGYLLSIYNYDTDKVDGGESWDDLTPLQAKEVARYIVSTKFQNGDVSYSTIKQSNNPTAREILADQQGALIEWLVGNKDKLDDLNRSFRRFIKKYRISNQYKGSAIEKAFKAAKKK